VARSVQMPFVALRFDSLAIGQKVIVLVSVVGLARRGVVEGTCRAVGDVASFFITRTVSGPVCGQG